MLQVLHPLLESNDPDIAVVGISNWSLDASKMNRAIHLSQPDPDYSDLMKTSWAILNSYKINKTECGKWQKQLSRLCESHLSFVSNQKFDHFFGLRDFYSLIKTFRNQPKNQEISDAVISMGIARNYGGIFEDKSSMERLFLQGKKEITAKSTNITKLIIDNTNDEEARHLLIISRVGF
jgi:E3 ubiquitin-protein ligase RNF213